MIVKLLTTWFILLFPIIVLGENNLPLHLLKLPPGFFIKVFAYPVMDAREMALGDKGTVFVGSISAGKVYAIIPNNNATNKTQVLTIASNLKMPNGVTFHEGALYVAESHRILRFDNIENNLMHPPHPIIVSNALPNIRNHGWRYIKFGPDNKLYLGIGAPCDACLSNETHFASIIRMDKDGSHFEVYAEGIRNSVGFAWDPVTQQLWFTDNSRDWLGDAIPPDELNHAPNPSMHFGFPFCHATNVADPYYGKKIPCSQFTPPKLELPAHVAALGMTFYTGKLFPKNFQNQIFIAEHGSWNRTTKVGYQVISVLLKDNEVIGTIPFITGWLHEGNVWGRPVDVLVMRDGSLLISDDYANVIYRVTYQK